MRLITYVITNTAAAIVYMICFALLVLRLTDPEEFPSWIAVLGPAAAIITVELVMFAVDKRYEQGKEVIR